MDYWRCDAYRISLLYCWSELMLTNSGWVVRPIYFLWPYQWSCRGVGQKGDLTSFSSHPVPPQCRRFFSWWNRRFRGCVDCLTWLLEDKRIISTNPPFCRPGQLFPLQWMWDSLRPPDSWSHSAHRNARVGFHITWRGHQVLRRSWWGSLTCSTFAKGWVWWIPGSYSGAVN